MDGYDHIQTKSIFIRRRGLNQDLKKIKGKKFGVILNSLLVYGWRNGTTKKSRMMWWVAYLASLMSNFTLLFFVVLSFFFLFIPFIYYDSVRYVSATSRTCISLRDSLRQTSIRYLRNAILTCRMSHQVSPLGRSLWGK